MSGVDATDNNADVDPRRFVGVRHPPLPEGVARIAYSVAEGPGGGIVREDRSVKYMTEVRMAWRVDREARRLVPADPSRVACENYGFGAR